MWLKMCRIIGSKYNVGYSKMRLITAIDGLMKLYGWRTAMLPGFTVTQVCRLMAWYPPRVRRLLDGLCEDGYMIRTDVVEGKRTMYRFRLSKKGQEIANKMSGRLDDVNEFMVSLLYEEKLLK